PVLVRPVRGNTELGYFVHAARAYLNLNWLAEQADDCGVQALVAVRLGHGHVILEPARDGRPQRVHYAQRAVTHGLLGVFKRHAVTHVLRLEDGADGHEVEYLIEVTVVALHLAS